MRQAISNTLTFALLTAATAAVLFSIGISLGHGQPRNPSVEPPASPVTPHDFNVWKDGKPTLCTQTKQDVYCY